MVQQNIVSYILSQRRQGKTLQEINEFLLKAGYDKQEVESSIQYVINTQSNPQLAEEQRIQQLAQYIQKQISAGYDKNTISNFLITRGYPYYEVSSAIQQLSRPKLERKFEHKLLFVALIGMVLLTGAVLGIYFKSDIFHTMPEKLLDVETDQLTTLVKQGGELNFEVNVINFGHGKRYDIILTHQVINRETNTVVLEKEETVALSTTLRRLISFDIPKDIQTGRYNLKTEAKYEEFTATSGFIFDVQDPDSVEEQIQKVEELLPPEEEPIEDVEELPEEEPVEEETSEDVEETQETTDEIPKEEPVTQPTTEEKFYEGMSKAQAFDLVKATYVENPDKAKDMCLSFKYSGLQEECLSTLAQSNNNPDLCKLINKTSRQDSCFIAIVQSSGNTELCELLNEERNKQICGMFSLSKSPGDFSKVSKDDLFGLVTKVQ